MMNRKITNIHTETEVLVNYTFLPYPKSFFPICTITVKTIKPCPLPKTLVGTYYAHHSSTRYQRMKFYATTK